MHDTADLEAWEAYEASYDPLRVDRQARRKRKPRNVAKHDKPRAEILADLGETTGDEAGFDTTYRPSRYEQRWLLEALRPFFDQALIVDVLAQVRGGKEATVYRCAGHPRTGLDLLAVKVYRPHLLRTLRNDALYREGRDVLVGEAQPVKKTNSRVMRALGKKTTFGLQVAHTSWLMHEYTAMRRLHRAGGDLPAPIAASENAILMAYWGDAQRAAPLLNEVTLEPPEAERLFDRVLHNVELLIAQGVVHGDLSAYNILYWEGRIGLIDFPQAASIAGNRSARALLRRDLERLCAHFAGEGVHRDLEALFERLWRRCGELWPLPWQHPLPEEEPA